MTAEEYSGLFDKLIYQNKDNGWAVGTLIVSENERPMTIVGYFPSAQTGQHLKVRGTWQHHAKFGTQFSVSDYDVILPSDIDAMETYLASGLIKGIGPVLAKRLIDHFGATLFTVMDTAIERLREVSGIGKQKWEIIKTSWNDHRHQRELLVFLQSYGISPKLAQKIYRTYGNRAIETLKTNPYQLIVDVSGIGFQKADHIAQSMGIASDSPFRLQAAILVSLQQALTEGHTHLPESTLIKSALSLLRDGSEPHVTTQLDLLLSKRKECLAVENLHPTERAIFLTFVHTCEREAALELKRLLAHPPLYRVSDSEIESFLDTHTTHHHFSFSPSQRQAIKGTLPAKVAIITGGPGTGKTTIIKTLLAFSNHRRMSVVLAAPTGRAAKRMQESTGIDAKTVHRLLEFDPDTGGFKRGKDTPLEAQIVIIDESSMLDIFLFRSLLSAISTTAQCILVGDAHQLPSVGPGNVLRDLIASSKLPVFELTEIFRQSEQSLIAVNAKRMQEGLLPQEVDSSDLLSDFYFIKTDSRNDILTLIRRLVTDRIPNRYGIPSHAIQVLSPMNAGPLGVQALNNHLQSWLNPLSTPIPGTALRIGDRVMQTRNNYDLEVFNGDIGIVAGYTTDTEELSVDFDDRRVHYGASSRDELVLAYAITVHKSQGSEYPAVIFPIVKDHYIMLRRNLVYTALTRAKQLAIFIGTPAALSLAIERTDTGSRYSGLTHWLR